MWPDKKVIIALGLILTAIGILLFPFGYDAVFFFVLSSAGGNYALATAWMYTVAIGVGSIGIILSRYAHKRKHFTNKYYVFGIIVIIMVVMFLALQAWRLVIDFTPAPVCP